MDSGKAGALALVGVGLVCGCCTAPPVDAEDEEVVKAGRSPEQFAPMVQPPPPLPMREQRPPERAHRPVPTRGQVNGTVTTSPPPVAPGKIGTAIPLGGATSSALVTDSPPPARQERDPTAAVVESELPMRTAIGPFCPIVEKLSTGTEVVVNTEAQDKRQVPWVSVTTPSGATGWLPKTALRLTHAADSGDGLDQCFEFRTLRHEGELEAWLDLVCEVFGDLDIPRSYFARHWSSDPPSLRKLSGVLVAVERQSGNMVATVRVFRRTIRLASGKQVTVGGLGEVSTIAAYRGRGICTRLLKMALAEMARSGLKASSLHAASAASAIYRRLGETWLLWTSYTAACVRSPCSCSCSCPCSCSCSPMLCADS